MHSKLSAFATEHPPRSTASSFLHVLLRYVDSAHLSSVSKDVASAEFIRGPLVKYEDRMVEVSHLRIRRHPHQLPLLCFPSGP